MCQDECTTELSTPSCALKCLDSPRAAETGYESARDDWWAAQEKRLVLQQYASLRHEMVSHLNELEVGVNACEDVARGSEDDLLRAGAHLFSKIPHQLRAFRDLSSYVLDPADLTPVITMGSEATPVITSRTGSASSATTISFELEAPSE